MQIKIFTIPVPGGERILEEMNAFLNSKRIIRTREKLVRSGSGGACRGKNESGTPKAAEQRQNMALSDPRITKKMRVNR